MMRQAIEQFPTQFDYRPKVQNLERLSARTWTIVAGMGGSHLAADLLRTADPSLPLWTHENYGLEGIPEAVLTNCLFIASSFSGNTEETLDAYAEAGERGIPRAALASGGKLLEYAARDGVPFVEMPKAGIQPRMALGFQLLSLLALMKREEHLPELTALARTLDPHGLESAGKKLADSLRGRVPVITASDRNRAVAYNWKIICNETAKIPAFSNVLPEMNHNEMTGFAAEAGTKELSEKFSFLLLTDSADHPAIQKRMGVLRDLYEQRGLPVLEESLAGKHIWEKIFSSLLLADWTAYHLAEAYGVEAEQVPMVEDFKRRLA